MICELYIKDFALIDEVRLEFDKGFNVITGETGSGKSIIIDAISLILGKKASKLVVKKGCNKAIIEALFSYESEDIDFVLEQIGIDRLENQIILTREISSDGRSNARINNRIVSLNDLKEISTKLISIHGQNEYEEFSNSTKQLKLVDSFGKEKIQSLYEKFSKNYREMTRFSSELSDLNENMDESKILRELDFLNFEIEEIENSKLKEDEDIHIKESLKMLENANYINDAKNNLYDLLYGKNNAIVSMLFRAVSKAQDLVEYVPEAKEWVDTLNEAYYNLEDLVGQIHLNNEEYNEDEIDNLNRRLSQINDIYRKYGKNFKEVNEYKKRNIERREAILSRETKSNELKEKIEQYNLVLNKVATELSKTRSKVSKALSQKLVEELDSLNMKNVNLEFKFEETAMNKMGMDNLDLMISFNKGEDLKSLNKVASGGEMSRFMLALKNIFAKYDDIESIIFDEIDTGVSGVAAHSIGTKLKTIGNYRQVICVSHLPKVASFATTHFSVYKKSEKNSTKTFVKKLNYDDRVMELSKMLTGEDVTEKTINVIKDMLNKNMEIR